MAKSKEDDALKKDLIKQFNATYPDDRLETLGDSELAEIPGWITTGNYALNWIISKNIFHGLPLGRIVLLSGDPASGKSMISLSMMREPSIDYIVYFDSEGGGITKDFAAFLGIDPQKILYTPVDTIEGMISRFKTVVDTIEKNKGKKNILMVVDSISMLSTEREMDPDKGQDMGNKAKVTRAFFRQYARKMQKLNICAVFTGHLTETIGGYGPSKVVTGGTILGYAPSVEVRFTKVKADSDIEQSAVGAKMIKIRAEIYKSRLGTTNKRVRFELDMEKGLDPYAGLFDILRDYGFIIPAQKDLDAQIEEKKVPKKSSGYFVFKPWDNKATEAMFQKMIDEGLVKAETRKFREKAFNDFCRDYDWFMADVQSILDSIYHNDEEEDKVETEIKEITIEEVKEEVKEVKKTRKKKTEVSAL